jgi:hypothetical protein
MHQFARENFNAGISVETTLDILRALKEVMTLPFRVDVGLLVSQLAVSSAFQSFCCVPAHR